MDKKNDALDGASNEFQYQELPAKDKQNTPQTVITPQQFLEHIDELLAEPPPAANADGESVLSNKIYIPTWDNKPPEQKAIVFLNGTPILTNENLSAIIAAPGLGKSSLCEAVAASFLNPDCETLGFEISPDVKGVLIVDFERTAGDVWNSFYRTAKRAGIQYGRPLVGLKIAALRHLPRLKDRLRGIEILLEQHPTDLLILDGAGDLIADTNDLLQSIECRYFLRELTTKFGLSILTTLHPNAGTMKPRGHIGSEICREAETVLCVKNHEGETRVITTDFEHGKSRNAPSITVGFRWSDEHKMFISCEIDEDAKKKKRTVGKEEELKELAMKILPPLQSKTHTDLIAEIVQETQKSKDTAKRLIADLTNVGFIKKSDDGRYRNSI